jgi:hypothetical protein
LLTIGSWIFAGLTANHRADKDPTIPALPSELRTDLPDTHGAGASHVAKTAVADVAARIRELRVVEYVEEFTPDLE